MGGVEEDAGRARGLTRGLTVAEAAEALGISAEAVRKRIARGILTTIKERSTVYILLSDADRTREDNGRTPKRTDLLIATLREQLQSGSRANEENRRIIAALTLRIPAIVAPQDAPKAAESRSSTSAEASEGRQEPAERVSWWRRVFGG